MAHYLTTPLDQVWPDWNHQERAQATRDVPRAEALIDARFPTLRGRVAAGQPSIEAVALVVEQMVERARRYDQNGGTNSIALPEYTIGFTDGGAGESTRLHLTLDEVMALSPSAEGTGAGLIRPRFNPWVS